MTSRYPSPPLGRSSRSPPADHVHVDLCHDRIPWHRGVIGEPLRPQQPQLLGGMGDEQDRASRALGRAGQRAGDFQQGDRARAIVVRAFMIESRRGGCTRRRLSANGPDTELFFRCRRPIGRIGPHRPHHPVEGPQGIVIQRLRGQADVIVVRRDRDVLTADRRITTRAGPPPHCGPGGRAAGSLLPPDPRVRAPRCPV